jgi:hypothetical protein
LWVVSARTLAQPAEPGTLMPVTIATGTAGKAITVGVHPVAIAIVP